MSAPTILIGLTGLPGVGKDTVGDLLQAAGWQRTSLAQALRIEVAERWHVDPRMLTDRTHKEAATPALAAGMVHDVDWLRWVAVAGHNLTTPRSPRWVLQHWASYRRSQRPDHWIRHVLVWLGSIGHDAPRTSCVITDVRYENEAAALRAHGGLLVRVHRPHGASVLAPDTAAHESEQHHQIRVDADLVNDGTYYDLAIEVRRVVHQLSTPTTAESGIDA